MERPMRGKPSPTMGDSNIVPCRAPRGAVDRRAFLRAAGAAVAGTIIDHWLERRSVAMAGPSTTSRPAVAPVPSNVMARFPEKTELILLTDRPPQLETPIRFFRQDLTPNEAFFVRWHLEGIPTSVDLRTFRLNLAGHVDRRMSLSADDLRRQFEPVSLIAV